MIITELPISDIKKNEDNNPLDIIKNTIKSRITLYEKTDNGDYFGYDEKTTEGTAKTKEKHARRKLTTKDLSIIFYICRAKVGAYIL